MSEKLAITITVLVLSTLLGIAKVVVEEKLIEISSKDKDQLDSNDTQQEQKGMIKCQRLWYQQKLSLMRTG